MQTGRKYYRGGYNEMTARVYDPNGASPTVRTCAGGNLEPKIAEPHTAAMRGRNPDNPSDRTAGLPTEQRLEIGGEVANALTTVQKDSLVVNQMEQVMFTNPIKEIFLLTKEIDENERISYETSRPLLRVLWQEVGKKEIQELVRGLSALPQKEVLQSRVYGESVCKRGESPRTDLSDSTRNGGESNGDAWDREEMLDLWQDFKSRYTPHRWELQEQQFEQFNLFMSKLSYETPPTENTSLQDLRSAYGVQRILQQTLYSLQKIWRPAISQGQGEIRVGQQIRVRKLTERETGRLMGVKDEDIDRIAQHQSKSSQYHLYGDSIVVPVLMAIFAPMFSKALTEEHINEIYKGESANV